ncbi:MAG TPA: thiamine phosphate synthase [Burkholderiaceae bacterium]|jgi:thiamine-phosphate pyrophosphorylase|nr:thiamine phosphate synthase [Burkholderiaceae bacterium]
MTHLRFPRGLYGVSPEWDDTDRLLAALEAAAAGGMTAFQLRRKIATPDAVLEQARKVVRRCRELSVVSIINDDWRLAALVDADGVHLGRDDGSLTDARIALGPDRIIGCSCYDNPALAERAILADVDYVAFGAMYPSKVKPEAVHAGPEILRQARRVVDGLAEGPLPAVVAIGGITPENAPDVVAAGADSIAVISGVFMAPDIEAAARRCADLFD